MNADIQPKVDRIIDATHDCMEKVVDARGRLADEQEVQAAKILELRDDFLNLVDEMSEEDMKEIPALLFEITSAARKLYV